MLNFVRKLDKAPLPPPPPPSDGNRAPLPPPPQQQQESPSSISFSQVDPEVLAELPEDIRKEIEQSCSLKAASTSSSTTKSPAVPAADHLEVTFSQLDPDVLAALPEELRSEVEQGGNSFDILDFGAIF